MRVQPKGGARGSIGGSEAVEKPVEGGLPRTPIEGKKRLNSKLCCLPPNAFDQKSAINHTYRCVRKNLTRTTSPRYLKAHPKGAPKRGGLRCVQPRSGAQT